MNAPTFTSTTEALGVLTAAMAYLAAADPTAMVTAEQAQCLQTLEQLDAIQTAARSQVLGAFTARQGYYQDADYSPRMWLINQTRVTRGTAAGHLGWARRAAAHPQIATALAAAEISASFARVICDWSDKLPKGSRDNADKILLDAARSGLGVRDLTALGTEMYEQSRPAAPQDDPGQVFEDRSVRLQSTYLGAGVLGGDLTPECAAVITTVLDALSAPAGAEDTRTHDQRYHDALEEALRRLVAAGLVPDRAGQPAKVMAHISLADLLALDADSVLLDQWTARVRAQWAAARAAASVVPGDGAAWLDGHAAEGFACDASVTPVVIADVNPAALEDLVRLCVELAGHGPGRCGHQAGPGTTGEEATVRSGTGLVPPTDRGREALEKAIIGKAVDLLSGPGGLASFLRRRQLGARLGGPSLPLDVGYSDTIPAAIRTAVKFRDQHCQWSGGCWQPAAACEVHHTKHKSRGGKTSVEDCLLLCFFHHHVAIHRWGWALALNPDGTTTAWNRDMTKVLHSHSPPARAG